MEKLRSVHDIIENEKDEAEKARLLIEAEKADALRTIGQALWAIAKTQSRNGHYNPKY